MAHVKAKSSIIPKKTAFQAGLRLLELSEHTKFRRSICPRQVPHQLHNKNSGKLEKQSMNQQQSFSHSRDPSAALSSRTSSSSGSTKQNAVKNATFPGITARLDTQLPVATTSTAPSQSPLPKDGFICPDCLKVERNLCFLHSHMQMHIHQFVGPKCSYCPRIFAYSTERNNHVKVSTGKQVYLQVLICLIHFLILFTNKFNLKSAHDGREGWHCCNYCQFKTLSRSEMVLHGKNHYTCPYCRLTVKTKAGFGNHFRACRQKYSLLR